MSVALIDWLLEQSMAIRGASVPFESTCATLPEYQSAVLSGGTRAKLLLRVSYPKPTPSTVVLGATLGTGQPSDTFFPKLNAIPPVPGAAFAPGYAEQLGCFWVEWIVGGAVFSTLCDLGAGSLSLPACDQVTVRFITLFAPVPDFGASKIVCAVLPYSSPGAVATLTRVPLIVTEPFSQVSPFRAMWARRWRCAISDGQAGALAPIPIGPLTVSLVDDPSIGGLSAEQVTFGDFLAGFGAGALFQGWIETGGTAIAYVLHNTGGLGAPPITAKIIEQIQVG